MHKTFVHFVSPIISRQHYKYIQALGTVITMGEFDAESVNTVSKNVIVQVV